MKKITLLGVPEAASDIARQMNRQLDEVLSVFADEALTDIRRTWPVKTGVSRDALRVDVLSGNVSIVCPVKYAQYIHLKSEVGPTYLTKIVGYIQQNLGPLGARTSARLRAGGG